MQNIQPSKREHLLCNTSFLIQPERRQGEGGGRTDGAALPSDAVVAMPMPPRRDSTLGNCFKVGKARAPARGR
eukprot:872608-Rhodomonas_salina.1